MNGGKTTQVLQACVNLYAHFLYSYCFNGVYCYVILGSDLGWTLVMYSLPRDGVLFMNQSFLSIAEGC